MRRLALPLAACLVLCAGCENAMHFGGAQKSASWGRDADAWAGPLDGSAERPAATSDSGIEPVALDAVPTLSQVDPRKVVYKGEFTVVVARASDAAEALRKLAEDLGGYVQRLTNDAVVLRVPAASFHKAADALEQIGTVARRDITAQDVTEEYQDLQMRLRNAQALVERLRELLEKAKNVEEATKVQVELSKAQTESERLQAQMNSLASRIAMSTLAVSLVETAQAPAELRTRLPFDWLHELGLDSLLSY